MTFPCKMNHVHWVCGTVGVERGDAAAPERPNKKKGWSDAGRDSPGRAVPRFCERGEFEDGVVDATQKG